MQAQVLDRRILPARHEQQPEALCYGDAAMPATMAAERDHTSVHYPTTQDFGAKLRQHRRGARGAEDIGLHLGIEAGARAQAQSAVRVGQRSAVNTHA